MPLSMKHTLRSSCQSGEMQFSPHPNYFVLYILRDFTHCLFLLLPPQASSSLSTLFFHPAFAGSSWPGISIPSHPFILFLSSGQKKKKKNVHTPARIKSSFVSSAERCLVSSFSFSALCIIGPRERTFSSYLGLTEYLLNDHLHTHLHVLGALQIFVLHPYNHLMEQLFPQKRFLSDFHVHVSHPRILSMYMFRSFQ